MTRQDFDTIDVVRLEVETAPAPGGLVNAMENGSGEQGAYFWNTPLAGAIIESVVDASTGGQQGLRVTFDAASAGPNLFYTQTGVMPVTPGEYVTGFARIESSTHGVRARVRCVNAANTAVTAQGPWVTLPAGAGDLFLPSLLAPADTAWMDIEFHPAGPGGVYPSSGYSRVGLRNVIVTRSGGPLTSTGVQTATTASYVNVMGPTHHIEVDRDGLNLGILTAEVLDSTLDPAESSTLRPGRRVRLRVLDETTGVWHPVFTGKAQRLEVTYEEKATPPKPPRVSLTATDAVETLANYPAPGGVGRVRDLPGVVESSAVPWDVNGSGQQVDNPELVAVSENASALDQVAITRDSRHATAWVDRRGVLRVYDRAQDLEFPNGGFEAGLDANGYVFGRAPLYATAARVTTPVRTGSGALRLTATSGAATWGYMGVHTLSGFAGMPVVGGRTYTATAYFRAATTGRACRIMASVYDGNTLVQSLTTPAEGAGAPVSTTTGWTPVDLEFTAVPTATHVSFTLTVEGALVAGEVHYIDDADGVLHHRGPLVIDEDRYSDIDVEFSTADLINSVNVTKRAVSVTGETIESTYGSYEDAASIREWGRQGQTFTVQGLEESEIEDFASTVLERNGTPEVRANSVVMPVRTTADLTTTALVDLYDEPTVRLTAKGIDQVLAVTRVRHLITPEKWLVEAAFSKQTAVAAPTAVPVLSNTPLLNATGTITLDVNVTGNANNAVYRRGDLVVMSGEFTVQIDWPAYSWVPATIAPEFRPIGRWEVLGYTPGAENVVPMLLNTDGTLQLRKAVPAGTIVIFSSTYPFR